MFDIGFWELLIIGVVALLVVGPERLPAVATFAGHWIGRIRRFANHMRDEIQQELETEHLKNVVQEQNRELQSLREEVAEARDEAVDAMQQDERTAAEQAPTPSQSTGGDPGGQDHTATPSPGTADKAGANKSTVNKGSAKKRTGSKASASKRAGKKKASKKPTSRKKTSKAGQREASAAESSEDGTPSQPARNADEAQSS